MRKISRGAWWENGWLFMGFLSVQRLVIVEKLLHGDTHENSDGHAEEHTVGEKHE